MRRSLLIVLVVLLRATQAWAAGGVPDACAKISDAIAALPATGGTVDARGFSGSQACAKNPFDGNSKPVEVIFGAATFSTAASWVLSSSVTLRGPIIGQFIIHYTGPSVAVDASGSSYCALEKVQISTFKDAATGFKAGNGSHYCHLDHVRITGTGTQTNTGTGVLLDGTSSGAYSGPITMTNLLVNGFKFGIKGTGTNVNASTWTGVSCFNCTLTGPFPVLAESKGIWFDEFFNGVGSNFAGGSIQNFAIDVQEDNGGSVGVDIAMAMEDAATPPWSVAYGTPSGMIRATNGNKGWLQQQSNGRNVTLAERRIGGNWIRESFAGTFTDVNTDTGSEMEWRWARGASLINGGSPTNKFLIHTGTAADAEPGRNYWKLLTTKFSVGSARPTGGTCALGDIVFNTTAGVGTNVGWVCTGAGSPGTWSPWGSVFGSATAGNSAIFASLGLGGAMPLAYGTITMSGAAANYILTDTNQGTKIVALQAGAGSITGGSLVLFPHNHDTARDSVKVGLYDAVGVKFCINNRVFASGTDVFCVDAKGTVVANGGITAPTFSGALFGNASTATALAADPTDCSGNDFAFGINASGVAQCAQPAFSNLSGKATSTQLPEIVVYTGQSNAYGVGMKQIFQSSASTAGLNLTSSADPSALAQGDVWINGSDLKFRDAAVTQTVEVQANKNAASGYAGLTADTKLNAAQGQDVWTLADLLDVTATTGAGSTVMLNEGPVLKSYTVGGLPAPGTVDRIAIVTDASSAGSCTAGDGNYRSLCRDTGSAWEPLGDGGGSVASGAKATASNPDSPSQAAAQPPSSDGTLVGGSISAGPAPSTPSNLSNVRFVGPGGYSTIQDALNSLPNATPPDVGGTIQITPNYSEVLMSGISITTESTTIEFLGPAVLAMGTNSIQVAPGLRNVVIRGSMPWGGYSRAATPAVTLDYRGARAAIQVGGPSALTENVLIENLYFSLAQAGTYAMAIDATYLQQYQFNNIRVNASAAATQIGIRVQGGSAAGHWSGAGVISLPYILMRSPGSVGVQYSTLGDGPTNQNEIRGGTIVGTNSSGIGVDYAASSGSGGNSIYSLAINGYQQGVRYTAGNAANVIFGGIFRGNGVDIQLDASANTNEVHGTNGGNGGILTVMNNGANNIVWSGGTIVSGFLKMPK